MRARESAIVWGWDGERDTRDRGGRWLILSNLSPGMPDMGNLFRFDLNINIPNIDFNIDFLAAFSRFNLISWECAVQINGVCESGEHNVAIDCRRPSLGQYLGKSEFWEEIRIAKCHLLSYHSNNFSGCHQDARSRDLSSYTLNMGSSATIERCISICKGRSEYLTRWEWCSLLMCSLMWRQNCKCYRFPVRSGSVLFPLLLRQQLW